MVKDAEAHAGEDKKRRELVEARNHADSLVHATEKNLQEYGDKVSGAERSAIESAVADLKQAVSSEDVALIQSKTQALAQASMKLGEAMYKASQAETAGGAGPGGAGGHGGGPHDGGPHGGGPEPDGKVVDADFEEVNDKKNKSA